VRADGSHLPVADGVCDAAYCIGGPSIVGPEPCLTELARAVKPGGHVIVSDIVWRRKPDGALGPEWGVVAEISPRLSRDEYTALIAAQGLAVSRVHIHERSAWEEYFRPMADVAREARASGDPDDLALAQEIERDIAVEGRAADAFLDYVTFLARRPD